MYGKIELLKQNGPTRVRLTKNLNTVSHVFLVLTVLEVQVTDAFEIVFCWIIS